MTDHLDQSERWADERARPASDTRPGNQSVAADAEQEAARPPTACSSAERLGQSERWVECPHCPPGMARIDCPGHPEIDQHEVWGFSTADPNWKPPTLAQLVERCRTDPEFVATLRRLMESDEPPSRGQS